MALVASGPVDGSPGHVDTPKLSVILCTFNGASTIGDQLDALAAQRASIPWELVVVDNRSTDGTADLVRSAWRGPASLTIVSAGDKPGLSYARNVGVEAALAPLLAFCDDDDMVDEGWVQGLADALDDHALVAPSIRYDRLNTAEERAGRAEFQSHGIETVLGMPVCSGACGVRRELWDALGGNDELLTGTGEDFDFSLRAQRLEGVTPYFAADAIYQQRLRSDSGSIFAQAQAFGSSHATLWARYGTGRVAPADELRQAVGEWWWVLTRAPLAAAGRNRAVWLRRAGRRIGRLRGSIRERVVLP